MDIAILHMAATMGTAKVRMVATAMMVTAKEHMVNKAKHMHNKVQITRILRTEIGIVQIVMSTALRHVRHAASAGQQKAQQYEMTVNMVVNPKHGEEAAEATRATSQPFTRGLGAPTKRQRLAIRMLHHISRMVRDTGAMKNHSTVE